jgi:hypothetical protein
MLTGNRGRAFMYRWKKAVGLTLGVATALAAAWCASGAADGKGFPDGYDAAEAAPRSHKVIFENSLVRVLQVTVPPAGTTEPMHHHRWPSFFLAWDTGGKSPHVRYQTPTGVRDSPSHEEPVHPGRWQVQWMQPEPMHAIESVERPATNADEPALLRIEIKTRN